MDQCVLIERHDGQQKMQLLPVDKVPHNDADVIIDVEYSTLNYKDALALTGRSPVLRHFPIVPGIDFAGRVAASRDPRFVIGELVLVNGCGHGERLSGGFTTRAWVSGDAVIPLPQAFSTRQAMAIGTAGFTAMLCVMALEGCGMMPSGGPILVTGAAGGVGSLAVSILSTLGYSVIASTGRPELGSYLRALGASEVIDRRELSQPGRPLERERWSYAVDVVGGVTLASVCAGTKARGAVAACGLAESLDLPLTVAPFILRGVRLVGIESANTLQREERLAAWARLASDIDTTTLDRLTEEIPLSGVSDAAIALLNGAIKGRLVVDTHR